MLQETAESLKGNNLSEQEKISWFYRMCVILSLIGLGRIIYIHTIAGIEQTDDQKKFKIIDNQYESIKRLLPPEIREVGYLTDRKETPFNDKHYLQANYALAPRIVVPMSNNTSYVLVNFERSISFDELQNRYGLLLLDSAKPNFGLFRKVSK